MKNENFFLSLFAFGCLVVGLLSSWKRFSSFKENIWIDKWNLSHFNMVAPNDKNSIVFIKTHKTGSSTVSGVLWRSFCISYCNHTCYLPPVNHAGRVWDFSRADDLLEILKPINRNIQEKPGKINVWVHHVRVNEDFIKYFSESPTIVISTVRRPSSRFQSAWRWYNHKLSTGKSLSEFISNLNESSGSRDILSKGFRYRTGLDATSEELIGLPVHDIKFNQRFEVLLELVRNKKIFLIVLDRLSECLVLMKHFLKIPSYDSLLNIPQKSLDFLSPKEILNENQIDVLDRQQSYDWKLYQAANNSLDTLIFEFGWSHFQQELAIYNDMLMRFRSNCSSHFTHSIHEMSFCEYSIMDNRELMKWHRMKLSSAQCV